MSNHLSEDMEEFPRAIIHVDGDAFFVGCELASRPWLRDRPVVVGGERGIASALSYKAKEMGVHRGMNMYEIRRVCPSVVVFDSHYDTYAIYSKRMFDIVSRYSTSVEHYSVDECFADITGMNSVLDMSYEDIAKSIKRDLDTELGMTFSIGLSITKVLAKCGSKHKKPSGFTIIKKSVIRDFLKHVSIGNVWGIGTEGSKSLTRENIFTASDLVSISSDLVRKNYNKPIQEIHAELSGEYVFKIVTKHDKSEQKSIMCTRTFRPFSSDAGELFAHLSKNIEEACARMRRLGLVSNSFSVFVKTKDFKYISGEAVLIQYTSYPDEILNEAKKIFQKIFDKRLIYRTTGVRFGGLKPVAMQTESLFGGDEHATKNSVYCAVDSVLNKLGEHSLFLGSSLQAIVKQKKEKKKLGIPSLGIVD
jgi:nucleotidyltransferase/DNA polymerase involved in DNA repair